MDLAQFSRRLIGLARTHLHAQLKYRVDPEDVVQSAYKSLFLRYGEQILDEDLEGLWGLLTTITVRKCADRARYYSAARRDAAREIASRTDDDPQGPLWQQAAGREPTPDQAAILIETVEELFGCLDAEERVMLEMSLQGFTTREISEHTGRAERSVRRLRERVRKHLERQQDQSP